MLQRVKHQPCTAEKAAACQNSPQHLCQPCRIGGEQTACHAKQQRDCPDTAVDPLGVSGVLPPQQQDIQHAQPCTACKGCRQHRSRPLFPIAPHAKQHRKGIESRSQCRYQQPVQPKADIFHNAASPFRRYSGAGTTASAQFPLSWACPVTSTNPPDCCFQRATRRSV